jgi:hypothetical protein
MTNRESTLSFRASQHVGIVEIPELDLIVLPCCQKSVLSCVKLHHTIEFFTKASVGPFYGTFAFIPFNQE